MHLRSSLDKWLSEETGASSQWKRGPAHGQTAAEVAAAFAVSVRTVRKRTRPRAAAFAGGGGGGHPSPAPDPADDRGGDRRDAGAGALDRLARWLRRAGLGRLAQLDPPAPVRRHQRERPGELIHLGIKKLGRFDRPGHRVTGRRSGCRNRGAGWLETWSATGSRTMARVHVAVDEATRLTYAEVLADARKATTTALPLHALRWFRARGIRARRVMTDNGSAHRSSRFAESLRLLGLRHIFTRPCTPWTSGKAERFIQTLMREWAYGLAYVSHPGR
jgi:transposase InsO family protein